MRFLISCSALLASVGLAHGAVKCGHLDPPDVPGAQIVTFSSSALYNVSGVSFDTGAGKLSAISDLNVCAVNLTLTHPGVGDTVGFRLWLPLKNWNQRFVASGGGGYSTGSGGTVFDFGIPTQQGFAVGTTDGSNLLDSSGSLTEEMILEPGTIDLGRFTDFSSRALHELAVVAKAVTRSFYGRKPKYSYWNGCSTGGRQGYMMAQQYPGDFDGILANAPALNYPGLLINLGWAEFTMRRLNHTVSQCVLNAFVQAAVQACDDLDGVVDGVIANTGGCQFDPRSIVGHQIPCGSGQETVVAEDAAVVALIMEGPKSPRGTPLFYPSEWGMNYTFVVPPDSPTSPRTLWDDWVSILVNKDSSYDINAYTELEQLVDFLTISYREYDGMIGTNNLDLGAFRDRGGKLLTWHGLADGAIPPANTIDYRQRVERVMGGNARVNEFYRLFLAPGIAHCFGGIGAFPRDAFEALIKWVEEDQPPSELHGTLPSGGKRKHCLYPLVAQYDGEGDPDDDASYVCAEGFEQ
ncbi:Tannase/feruloyl esterase [Aspergillus pseudodeflectus]|uniref:Carboxylic ester hydrolase n=1 Tax=Aspergillus pseudodeflectus TaxID=176178 RepID=A0ABR4JFL7_9EURO